MHDVIQILAPLGNHFHPRGLQIVDKESFVQMKKNMTRFFFFTKKIPIFIRHPDDSRKVSFKEAVGFVKELILTDDAICIVCSYNEQAYNSLLTGWAISPRWQMKSLPSGDYRPIKLLSIGLTDKPNIAHSGTIFRIK